MDVLQIIHIIFHEPSQGASRWAGEWQRSGNRKVWAATELVQVIGFITISVCVQWNFRKSVFDLRRFWHRTFIVMRIHCRWSLGESTPLEYILSWCFEALRLKTLPMPANAHKGMLCLSPLFGDSANEVR